MRLGVGLPFSPLTDWSAEVGDPPMIRDGQIFCDTCGTPITRTTAVLEGDGARMHNVCSECFTTLKKRSIPPA